MLRSWTNVAMLALESQQVIWMRCAQFAVAGPGFEAEAQRMVTEKVTAAMNASSALLTGASPDRVVQSYRRKVRANARRLSR